MKKNNKLLQNNKALILILTIFLFFSFFGVSAFNSLKSEEKINLADKKTRYDNLENTIKSQEQYDKNVPKESDKISKDDDTSEKKVYYSHFPSSHNEGTSDNKEHVLKDAQDDASSERKDGNDEEPIRKENNTLEKQFNYSRFPTTDNDGTLQNQEHDLTDEQGNKLITETDNNNCKKIRKLNKLNKLIEIVLYHPNNKIKTITYYNSDDTIRSIEEYNEQEEKIKETYKREDGKNDNITEYKILQNEKIYTKFYPDGSTIWFQSNYKDDILLNNSFFYPKKQLFEKKYDNQTTQERASQITFYKKDGENTEDKKIDSIIDYKNNTLTTYNVG
ncbi:hypothetical protein [Candidatus Phytoplasma pruni]|uniref:DUF2963 domain-containing protein n=1 Tax=Candidatus Phytoplasma pruni TaxID=479893 RepID=A0A851HC88_9MOLU|nr:hypothetical protein [Candidatus Phytoplasma pruni]NWN45608.1 hypothetical protein [Candidatus Phytoplasma pruni]